MTELSKNSAIVAKIHAARGQIVLAITGGGTAAIANLLVVPGGSRTVLEAVVPYSAESLAEFIGGQPENFCSPRTARLMAMAAFQRARHLQRLAASDQRQAAIGVGCTASLVSDHPKR